MVNVIVLCVCGEEVGCFLFGKEKDVYFLLNGIDFDLFVGGCVDIELEKRKWGIVGGCLVIGYIGCFIEEKNY